MAPSPGEQEFRELIEEFETALKRVQQKTEEIVDNVNRVLSKVPGFVGDGIRESTERFVSLINKIYAELNRYMLKPGWPPTLLRVGNAWADDVGSPVSALAGAADPDKSAILDEWKGPAADAYKRMLGAQLKAITSIKKDFTDAIHGALTATAAAIVVWWGSILVAITALVGGLIGAAASTASVFGAPAGPFIAIAACLVFLTALTAGTGTLYGVTAVQEGNLRDRINEWLAFDGHRWPVSAADKISDGTLRDKAPAVADGTDWRLEP
ncbi:hypothetical protein [Micromonospora sp. NBC_01796]|uniref:hypothetical protein n=1 Tax=Micromonospora sp. NBC_01796 TaxID=2975987 RepID=UPI002DD8BE38|nr:hypothetical protein [Micromonospora sp. NBC_01796]WSA84941.1 hypothetical protein OIE47_32025 [Micromonospora sp. NBC_01796]